MEGTIVTSKSEMTSDGNQQVSQKSAESQLEINSLDLSVQVNDLAPLVKSPAQSDQNFIDKDNNNSESLEMSNRDLQNRPSAVVIRNAIKQYGLRGTPVLNNLNMTVQQGTIYSLLGSSGCGKTTILTCIVGIRFLSSGEILVFGSKPGTKGTGIPGKRVGYMPQDFALYQNFSIFEMIRYYGTLYGMNASEINSRHGFLASLLNLPDQEIRICCLSGGEKRRVSIAVALIHSPELLILDEPTVGVDPLLRESIWSYLTQLTSTQNTTVIITTHYIEEARQSHMIGLMRSGRLLVERNPESLIEEHKAVSLEPIVLKLCKLDEHVDGKINSSHEYTHVNNPYTMVSERNGNYRKNSSLQIDEFGLYGLQRNIKNDDNYTDWQTENLSNNMRHSLERIRALANKNISVMTRNLIFVIFLILVPAMQIIVVCTAVGGEPRHLNIGFVNSEANCSDFNNYFNNDSNSLEEGGCDIALFSCKYLAKLPSHVIIKHEYETEDSARMAVQAGKIWGFMSFPEFYSDNLYARSAVGNIPDSETINGSQIGLEMDMSNKQIGLTLKRIFYESYMEFVTEMLEACGFDPSIGESPLQYKTPIYGIDDISSVEFLAPSALLGVVFFFPLCSSSISYIWDKKQGTLERSFVAGVKTWEVMLAFFMTEGSILLIQLTIVFVIMTVAFGIAVKGSILLSIALSLLMGLSGVSMGFLIGSFCNEEMEAVLLAMATYFPNALLSGMLWPVEGMPIALQYFAYLLPCTLASESIRSIVSRGWGFLHPNVWPGFVTTFAWICIYWSATICIHRVTLTRK